MSLSTDSQIFTVSQLNQTVQQLLMQEIGRIWLSGEISNFCQPASGHWYFTLKDDQAQVRCTLFYNRNRHLAIRPQNGQQILVQAVVSLYPPRGDYQLMVEILQPLGEGLLQQRFVQLKQQLAAEGLFAAHHKKPLPRAPQRLGIITSASGAALQDILQVLRRRDPTLPVIIYPTAVQGNEAPAQLVQAIACADQRNECDILIIARGGGSLEDLWSFNEAAVARAIFACHIPIVSAIGHETDITIADLVADLRAPTPSAAAELVSRDQQVLCQQLDTLRQYLTLAADHATARHQAALGKLQHRLHQQHPQLRLIRQQAMLLKLKQRLQNALSARLQLLQQHQQRLQQRLAHSSPLQRLHHSQQRVQQQRYRLQQALLIQQHHQQQRFGELCARLESISPLGTLARGFTITCDSTGNPIRTSKTVSIGQTLQTRLQQGWLESVVTAAYLNTQ